MPSSPRTSRAAREALLNNAAKAIIGPNIPGCIALADPTDGPTCAAQYEQLLQCEGYGCAGCVTANPDDYTSCAAAADDGACHEYLTNKTTNCQKDFACTGVYHTVCTGADDATTTANVLNEICGTGQ